MKRLLAFAPLAVTVTAAMFSHVFLIGVVMAVACVVAGVCAIGPERAGTWLLALAEALRATSGAPELRAELIAALMRAGYTHESAETAVAATARGPRGLGPWLGRALHELEATKRIQ